MASAWDRIGVDWLNLRDVRLSPVINEIYKATVERDYWLRVTGREVGVSPISTVAYNTSYQIRKIYELFEKWYRPINTNSSFKLFDYNESSYIYDDGDISSTPLTISNRAMAFNSMYGKGSVDYSSGGILSSLVGFDMSFLVNGVPQGRINTDHLESFFKVLNLNLKNRLFTCVYSNNVFTSNSSRSDDFLRELLNNLSGNENNGDVGDVINEFNSKIIPSDVVKGSFYTSYVFGAGRSNTVEEEYGAGFQQRFFMFKDFDVANFDIDSYVYGDEDIDDGFSISYSPSAPYNEIIRNNIISVTWEGQQVNAFLPYIPTVISSMSGDNAFDSVNVTFNSQNFIDINNSELIKYYTETTN